MPELVVLSALICVAAAISIFTKGKKKLWASSITAVLAIITTIGYCCFTSFYPGMIMNGVIAILYSLITYANWKYLNEPIEKSETPEK